MPADLREMFSGRIARRLIVAIVLFSSALAVLTTALQLAFDYRHDLGAIDASIEAARLAQSDALVANLAAADWPRIQRQLDGLLHLPDLEWVALSVDGQVARSAGTRLSQYTVTRRLPLHGLRDGRQVLVGELEVVASIDQVVRRLAAKTGLILLGNAVKTLLVVLFVFFIVDQWVTRHLRRLARHAGALMQGGSAAPLALAAPERPAAARDEVDALIVAVNRVQESLGQAFEALRAEKELAQVTLRSIGDAVVTTDAQGRVTFMNRMAETLTGWDAAAAAGKPLADIYHIINFKTRQVVDDPVKTVLARGGTVVQMANDTTLIARHGHEYQIANSGAPIFGAAGAVCGVVLVFRDVSEEYALLASLADRERNLRAVTDAVQDAIVRVDQQGRVVFINRAAEKLFGTPAAQAVGREVHEWIAPRRFHDKARQGFAAYAAGGAGDVVGKTLELLARRADGGEFPIELTVSPLQTPQGWHAVGVVRDISERRRAEAEQRLAAQAFETTDAILITDRSGTILRTNRAFAAVTGYAAAEALGRNPRLLQSGRQGRAFYAELWADLLATGQWRGEVWNRRKNGEVFPGLLSISAVRDSQGEVSNYVGVLTDLTELKAEQRLREIRTEEEAFLGRLLRLSLRPSGMEAYLQEVLEELLSSVTWMQLWRQGKIFLVDKEAAVPSLRLAASHISQVDYQEACALLPFGRCLCGRAAATREIQFAGDADVAHEIRYAGIAPHSHYVVPVTAESCLLGVFCIYLPPGHCRHPDEETFLARVADVLSMGITRREAEAEIEHYAYHDPLTDLPNRRMLMERLRHEMALGSRQHIHGALIFIDLDHFKSVNDLLGHVIGDRLLRLTTARLQSQLRVSDMVARLGGDEFVVLLPALGNNEETAARQAQLVADKLRSEIAQPYRLDEHEFHCSASMGVVLFPREGESADDLLRHADTAMYSAKGAGRNAVQFYLPAMQAAVEQRIVIESDLRRALAEEQFVVYYQPQIAVGTGRIIGAEALVRWQHPRRGLVAPGEFIPVAEETGMILSLGDWILRTALAQLADWQRRGVLRPEQTLSVNVSPRQFHQPDFVDKLAAIIAAAAVPPASLKLEITEGMVIADVDDTIRKMEALKAIGTKFSMDDFGTGYSSLSYLKRLPLDQLKIDKSFIHNLPRDGDDAAIVMSILDMARNLRLEVIAEGVEGPEELAFLQEQACFGYQGYFFSRPVTAGQFGELLASRA